MLAGGAVAIATVTAIAAAPQLHTTAVTVAIATAPPANISCPALHATIMVSIAGCLCRAGTEQISKDRASDKLIDVIYVC